MPADDVQADLYELTQARLAEAGLVAYEISNHAKPGEACRHNLLYWRSGEWLGIGPGAHGRLELDGQRLATTAWRLPKAWLERVERSGTGERTRVALSRAEQAEELLVMGLRLSEGVDLGRLEATLGRIARSAARPRRARPVGWRRSARAHRGPPRGERRRQAAPERGARGDPSLSSGSAAAPRQAWAKRHPRPVAEPLHVRSIDEDLTRPHVRCSPGMTRRHPWLRHGRDHLPCSHRPGGKASLTIRQCLGG